MLGTAGGAVPARPRPPAIVSATVAEDALTIRGADFGEERPRVTLGTTELLVLTSGRDEIVARLPEDLPPGSYQLLVHPAGERTSQRAGVFTLTIAGSAVDPENADSVDAASLTPRGRRVAAGCYRHWGSTTCMSGFDATLTGRPGGIESYSNGGALYDNLECVSGSAPALQSFTTPYQTRLMRSDAEGDGMQIVDNSCAVCCRGGCYTALGTDTCAPGYSATYTGRVGGIEAYNGAQFQGQTLCVDSNAAVAMTFTSGYSTRLMRHRAPLGGTTGMDAISGVCAVCCKP
jgi:hypothetical protein